MLTAPATYRIGIDWPPHLFGGGGTHGSHGLMESQAAFLPRQPAERQQPAGFGFLIGDRVLAIPHNILWWHEVMNLNLPEGNFAVTYCPLTGTSMAFDRASIGGAELDVSGILLKNNLVMFDRCDLKTLWPEIMGMGIRGLGKQTILPQQAE